MKLRIGTNTKMYMTIAQTCKFIDDLGRLTADIDREEAEIFVIPPYTSLDRASEIAARANIRLGAQNMCWADEGQFTGEISPVMLKEVDVQIAEIGHSERRHVFHETDEMENMKVITALRHGFTPLLCVGETAEQKDRGQAAETIRSQLTLGLKNVSKADAEKLWIAYEPVWAIGVNGTPASPDYAGHIHGIIRSILTELFDKAAADKIPILYGGSVNPENACKLIVQPDVDGLFIGRSAWDAERFNGIIRDVLNVVNNA